MRPQALTRKNALFAGHDDGAENWAILATLIETAKLNSIEPHAWLADILTRWVNLCDRCRSIGTRLDHVQRGHPFGMTVRPN